MKYTEREREKKKEACRGVDFGTAWYDTSWTLSYHVYQPTGTDPARCLVHASTNLASAMVLRVPPGTFKLQHCKSRRREKKETAPNGWHWESHGVFVYPPEIRLHIRPWKVAVGRWGNTFRMGWWDMLVHPMSLEISQVRSATTKAGFTYLKLQSFLPRH